MPRVKARVARFKRASTAAPHICAC
jgi:hypothetical protein